MHGHGAAPDAASAQVAVPTTRRGSDQPSRRTCRRKSRGFGDRGNTHQRDHAFGTGLGAIAGRLQFGFRYHHQRDAEFRRGGFDAGFILFRRNGRDGVELMRADAGARQRGQDHRFHIGRRRAAFAADSRDDHGLVQTHCVTGIAGAPAGFFADRVRAGNRDADQFAAAGGMARQQQRFGFERHRIGHEPAAGAQCAASRR